MPATKIMVIRHGEEPEGAGSWKGDEAALAAAAMASQGAVLICWQHKEVPTIGNLIIPQPNAIPQTWPGNRYDVIWVFDPPETPGQGWTFSQMPQNLLAGDVDGPTEGTCPPP